MDRARESQALKNKAALVASRPGVVDHVRRTGRIPADVSLAGAHIGARLLVEKRGWDITLSDDEKLVYDALLRDLEEKPQAQEVPPNRRDLDLIYGEDPFGDLVFVERAKAEENIAFWKAKTWGDLRVAAPMLYERALEYSEYFGTEKLPSDDKLLDHQIADDGDFLFFPKQLMLDFIPDTVQQKYGRVGQTVFNGPILELDWLVRRILLRRCENRVLELKEMTP